MSDELPTLLGDNTAIDVPTTTTTSVRTVTYSSASVDEDPLSTSHSVTRTSPADQGASPSAPLGSYMEERLRTLEHENQTLRADKQRLVAEKDAVTLQLGQSQRKGDALLADLRELLELNKKMGEEHHTKAMELLMELQTKENRISELESENRALQSQITQLQQQRGGPSADSGGSQAPPPGASPSATATAEQESEASVLRARLATLQSRYETLERSSRRDLEAKTEEYQAQLKELRASTERLNHTFETDRSTWAADRDRLTREMETLRDDCTTQREAAVRAQSQLDQLQGNNVQVANVAQQLADVSVQLSQVRDERDKLTQALTRVQSEKLRLAEEHELAERNLRAEISRLNSEGLTSLQHSERQWDSVRQRVETERDDWKRKYELSSRGLEDLSKQLRSIEADAEQLEALKVTNGRLSGQVGMLQSQLAASQTEQTQLRTRLSLLVADQQDDTYKQQVAELGDENAKLRQRIDELTRQVSELKSALVVSQGESDQLRARVADLSATETASAEQTERIKELERLVGDLETRVEQEDMVRQQLGGQITQLNSLVAQLRADRDALKGQQSNAGIQVSALVEGLKETKAKNSELRERLEKKTQLLDEQHELVEKLKSEVLGFEVSLNAVENNYAASLQQAQTEAKTAQTVLDETNMKLIAAQSRLSDLEAEAEQLRRKQLAYKTMVAASNRGATHTEQTYSSEIERLEALAIATKTENARLDQENKLLHAQNDKLKAVNDSIKTSLADIERHHQSETNSWQDSKSSLETYIRELQQKVNAFQGTATVQQLSQRNLQSREGSLRQQLDTTQKRLRATQADLSEMERGMIALQLEVGEIRKENHALRKSTVSLHDGMRDAERALLEVERENDKLRARVIAGTVTPV